MKPGFRDVILFFTFIVKHVTGKQVPHIDPSELISQLHLDPSKQNPLIVVVDDPKKVSQQDDEPDFDDLPVAEGEGFNHDDDDVVDEDIEVEAKKQARQLLFEYFLRQSPDDEVKPALLRALRARCQAAVKCEKKCPKKSKEYCVPNCKAVFDKLDLCDTPKKEEKKKKGGCGPIEESSEDKCEKRGRTMPPKWF